MNYVIYLFLLFNFIIIQLVLLLYAPQVRLLTEIIQATIFKSIANKSVINALTWLLLLPPLHQHFDT